MKSHETSIEHSEMTNRSINNRWRRAKCQRSGRLLMGFSQEYRETCPITEKGHTNQTQWTEDFITSTSYLVQGITCCHPFAEWKKYSRANTNIFRRNVENQMAITLVNEKHLGQYSYFLKCFQHLRSTCPLQSSKMKTQKLL